MGRRLPGMREMDGVAPNTAPRTMRMEWEAKTKMGQRLTERTNNGVAYIGKHTKMPGLENASSMRVAAVRDVMQRLADYEDTGLDPEQIKQILPQVSG